MKKLFLLFSVLGLCLFSAQVSHGQSAEKPLEFGLRAGVILGGPIPTQLDPDSSSGSLAIGPSAGFFVRKRLSPRWRIQAELAYSYKGATYSQLSRNDTMVAIELIPGVQDTVPTFYYADVNGQMKLHYIELPVFAQVQLREKMWLSFGGYLGFLRGGEDAGTARIQIGEGAVFDDTTTVFDNIDDIRRLDAGVMLGGMYEFDWGLQVEFRAIRSLVGLYREGFLREQGLEEIALYHTQFYLGVGWVF